MLLNLRRITNDKARLIHKQSNGGRIHFRIYKRPLQNQDSEYKIKERKYTGLIKLLFSIFSWK